MKINHRLGGYLALIGAVLGIVGTYVLFFTWYAPALSAEAAEPGCEILLKYLMPALSDFGLLAAALYAVSAYGFFTKTKWAFPLVVIANVLALQGSWFLNVPFMAASLPPVYFIIFFPNLILFFLFMKVVRQHNWKLTLVALFTGGTMIFCFMNGVASWSRIITIGTELFIVVQQSHWIAFIGWGVVTAGILIGAKGWMKVLALCAGTLELIVGIPLAISTTAELQRFSLFSLGPIFSFIFVVILLWPGGLWERLTGTVE